MNDLSTYLKRHYHTADQLAAVCSISPDELAILVSEKLAPEPSYTVTEGGKFISQAFGEFQVQGLAPERYFHRGNAIWVALAMEEKVKNGPQQAHDNLKEQFMRNFGAALAELDKTTF